MLNLITDARGKLIRQVFMRDSIACADGKRVNNFVPIEITLLRDPFHTATVQYIFWYDRTSEFLNLLPKQIRKALGSNGPSNDILYTSKSDDQYEVRSVVEEADKTLAQIRTLAPCNTASAFTIYDIQGRKLETAVTHDPFKPADVSLSFATIEPGIYQLALQSQDGAPILRRMVVEAADTQD